MAISDLERITLNPQAVQIPPHCSCIATLCPESNVAIRVMPDETTPDAFSIRLAQVGLRKLTGQTALKKQGIKTRWTGYHH